MRSFRPSATSYGAQEPLTLIWMKDKALANPTIAGSNSVRWEAPDGTILDLNYSTLEIVVAAPAKYAGYRFKPGTKGYRAYVDAMASDWDKNASLYQSYINWPTEREVIETAREAALQKSPETDLPVDAQGVERDPPGTDWATILKWSGLGVLTIGCIAAIVISSRRST